MEIPHGLYNLLTLGLDHVIWPNLVVEHQFVEVVLGKLGTWLSMHVCTVYIANAIYFETVSFMRVIISGGRVQ